MTTYTVIADANLDPGAPTRSIDAKALRDNPIAITEGATGAPRVRTAALYAPSAGTAYTINRIQIATVSTTATSYPDEDLHKHYSHEQHLGVSVLVAGTITVSVDHRKPSGASNARVRVLKNGSLVQEWLYTDLTFAWATRQVNVTVAIGDIIVIQQAGGNSEWRNLIIYSNNPDMAVA